MNLKTPRDFAEVGKIVPKAFGKTELIRSDDVLISLKLKFNMVLSLIFKKFNNRASNFIKSSLLENSVLIIFKSFKYPLSLDFKDQLLESSKLI